MTTGIDEMREMNRSLAEIGGFMRERTDALSGEMKALGEENESR